MSLSDDADSVQNLRDRIDELGTALERCQFQLRIEEVKEQIRIPWRAWCPRRIGSALPKTPIDS